MSLKVDIRVPVGLPVLEAAAFIAGCEATGICDALGLLGTAEECLTRLKRAQND